MLQSYTKSSSSAFKCKWYDKELLKLLRKNDRLYKAQLTQKTSHSLTKYHSARNKYYHLINLKKKEYVQNKFRGNLKNIKIRSRYSTVYWGEIFTNYNPIQSFMMEEQSRIMLM